MKRKFLHPALMLLIAISLLVLIPACQSSNEINNGDIPAGWTAEASSGDDIQVRLIVTRDFGNQLLLDETVQAASDSTAMSLLQRIASIETSYGGGFVNSINGIRSGYSNGHRSRDDWFISVNGITSNRGALDYILNDGDITHWDFHNWSFRQFIPATIGTFPEPFLHGYGGNIYPTIIVYSDGLNKSAECLADTLKNAGVIDLTVMPLIELSSELKASANIILIAESDSQPILEINDLWRRLGFYVHIGEDFIEVYDEKGEIAEEYITSMGFIQATQNPWNPRGLGACENVLWIISGTDQSAIENAADILCQRQQDIKYAYSAIIDSGILQLVPSC